MSQSRTSNSLLLCWGLTPVVIGMSWCAPSPQGATRSDPAFWVVVVVVIQIIAGLSVFAREAQAKGEAKGGGFRRAMYGLFGALQAVLVGCWSILSFVGPVVGPAWGRPLRVKGRQLHPELTTGADWTAGALPSCEGLDDPTRAALEALWLHDAQKEHASVPAFSRISWLLAAVGAPADLMAWSHRAALEEIEHAQRCFALAAGYGGRSFTVEPMPDLLLGGVNDVRDPLVTLAVESLQDGCLLEDFNADVAGRCAAVCEEPVTRAVLEQIAVEERRHAEFSWALLEWLLRRHSQHVAPALDHALARLDRVPRPNPATASNQRLIDAADAHALRRHGRLGEADWEDCWTTRVAATRARMAKLREPRLSQAA